MAPAAEGIRPAEGIRAPPGTCSIFFFFFFFFFFALGCVFVYNQNEVSTWFYPQLEVRSDIYCLCACVWGGGGGAGSNVDFLIF